jgi:hypothetical protein
VTDFQDSDPGTTRRRRRKRVFVAVITAAAIGAVALVACDEYGYNGVPDAIQDDAPDPEVTASLPSTPVTTKPTFLKHGWDVPSPTQVRANAAAIEALPFDGITIALPDELSAEVQSQTPVSRATLRTALAPLEDAPFTEKRSDFVMAYAAPAGDLFDDWSVPFANFANLAAEARAAGLEGVFYDIEEYFGDALRFPENCVGRPVEECQTQAQLRGKQVMDAMRSTWPDVRVITTFGPWVSERLTARNLPGVPYNDIAWANPLSGPFVVGLVESAVNTPALLVDGGEIYTARTAEDYAVTKSWMETGMPASSPLIPDSLRAVWASTVSSGFGVYDSPWIGVDMDLDDWTETLGHALDATDEYVWAYTERYDWLGTGWPEEDVPAEWVDATRTVRTDP